MTPKPLLGKRRRRIAMVCCTLGRKLCPWWACWCPRWPAGGGTGGDRPCQILPRQNCWPCGPLSVRSSSWYWSHQFYFVCDLPSTMLFACSLIVHSHSPLAAQRCLVRGEKHHWKLRWEFPIVGQVVDSDAFAKLSLEDATLFNFDWGNYSQ